MTERTLTKARMNQLKSVIEAALMASEVPLSVRKIRNLFDEAERPAAGLVNEALDAIGKDCKNRGIELRQIGKGYRFQTKESYAPWLRKLRDTRPPRYSRALIETLSIIAYRQPVTRGDIEGIRGVAVSSDIMRTLLDREWISQVGHRDVPGRPALYATTDEFLAYFNLRSLSDLPALIEPRDITDVAEELNIRLPIAAPEIDAGSDVVHGDGADDHGDYDEDDDDDDDDYDDDVVSVLQESANDAEGDALAAGASGAPENEDDDAELDVPEGNGLEESGTTRSPEQTHPAATHLKVISANESFAAPPVDFSDLDTLDDAVDEPITAEESIDDDARASNDDALAPADDAGASPIAENEDDAASSRIQVIHIDRDDAQATDEAQPGDNRTKPTAGEDND